MQNSVLVKAVHQANSSPLQNLLGPPGGIKPAAKSPSTGSQVGYRQSDLPTQLPYQLSQPGCAPSPTEKRIDRHVGHIFQNSTVPTYNNNVASSYALASAPSQHFTGQKGVYKQQFVLPSPAFDLVPCPTPHDTRLFCGRGASPASHPNGPVICQANPGLLPQVSTIPLSQVTSMPCINPNHPQINPALTPPLSTPATSSLLGPNNLNRNSASINAANNVILPPLATEPAVPSTSVAIFANFAPNHIQRPSADRQSVYSFEFQQPLQQKLQGQPMQQLGQVSQQPSQYIQYDFTNFKNTDQLQPNGYVTQVFQDVLPAYYQYQPPMMTYPQNQVQSQLYPPLTSPTHVLPQHGISIVPIQTSYEPIYFHPLQQQQQQMAQHPWQQTQQIPQPVQREQQQHEQHTEPPSHSPGPATKRSRSTAIQPTLFAPSPPPTTTTATSSQLTGIYERLESNGSSRTRGNTEIVSDRPSRSRTNAADRAQLTQTVDNNHSLSPFAALTTYTPPKRYKSKSPFSGRLVPYKDNFAGRKRNCAQKKLDLAIREHIFDPDTTLPDDDTIDPVEFIDQLTAARVYMIEEAKDPSNATDIRAAIAKGVAHSNATGKKGPRVLKGVEAAVTNALKMQKGGHIVRNLESYQIAAAEAEREEALVASQPTKKARNATSVAKRQTADANELVLLSE